MNHYSPTPETDRPLTMEEIYLVDSGGQYKVPFEKIKLWMYNNVHIFLM